MQSSSSPEIRRPREEDSFSLEQVKRGGGMVTMSSVSAPPTAIEAGTPRGKETTIGSCSGLTAATSTLTATVEGVRPFGGADVDCLEIV